MFMLDQVRNLLLGEYQVEKLDEVSSYPVWIYSQMYH